jgi:hypothetical protein
VSDGLTLVIVPAEGFRSHSQRAPPEHSTLISLLEYSPRKRIGGTLLLVFEMTEFAVKNVKERVGASAFLQEYSLGVILKSVHKYFSWLLSAVTKEPHSHSKGAMGYTDK